jgi:hypothetical protein
MCISDKVSRGRSQLAGWAYLLAHIATLATSRDLLQQTLYHALAGGYYSRIRLNPTLAR